MSLHLALEQIARDVDSQLAAGADPEQLRVAVLGRKGSLTGILRQLAVLSDEEKRVLGAEANALKETLTARLAEVTQPPSSTTVDPTVPPYPASFGTIHPISAVIEEMVAIFRDLSFEVVEGNQIVSEADNFDMLNFLPDHPARDAHDSLTLTDSLLLRTHTSAIQVREMQQRAKRKQLPIRIVAPGMTYRRESDPTHSPVFHQMEALMVDTQTTLADLKGTLAYFVERFFGADTKVRFRPHYFPFTEPSAELDILWRDSETGQTRWLEVAGCGMVHPVVLKNAGINPRIYQGWAFGLAVERPFMIRHNLKDIRVLFGNSLDFLSQFS